MKIKPKEKELLQFMENNNLYIIENKQTKQNVF